MTRLFFALCLLLTVRLASAAPLTLTLPDTGAYSYWVQSKAGTVTTLPTVVSHRQTLKIAGPVAAGDRLCVLDSHTGQVAVRAVTPGPGNVPADITLAVADFAPLAAPAAAMPAAPTGAAAVPRTEVEPVGGGLGRLVTALLSLLLAGGVVWVVFQLVKTRGEPLRVLARRFGVDPPEPPPLDAEEKPAPVYAPLKRAPEPVPEAAGLAVPSGPLPRPAPVSTLPGIPALVGLQGIATGSTFALSVSEVIIGRDGENEIVLAENTVSRRHAQILRDSQGQFTLADLGSANGVYVNGMRVQRAILSAGDEIKIGDNYFRFQSEERSL